MELLIKKLDERAVVPKAATGGSAGMDLCAVLDEPLVLEPGCRAMVPTGLAIALPDNNLVALIFARSGLAVKYGITLSNCVGVVDADYRGPVCVALHNDGEVVRAVTPGQKIAQLVVVPFLSVEFEEVETLSDTVRGVGGFGSTGK